MQNNIFVDTNIVVDICDDTRAYYKNSFEYVTEYASKDDYELFINSDTLTNLFYILSNHSTLSKSEVLDKMSFVSEVFTLVSIESKDVEKALSLCSDSSTENKDYEDAMQYICAKKINADTIVTNDKKFVSKDIKIITTV